MDSNVSTVVTADETIITINVPAQDPTLFRRATNSVTIARSLVIDCPALYAAAGEDLVSVKSLLKRVEAQRDAEVRPLNAKVKEINDDYRAPREWLVQAEGILKTKMLAFKTEQDRIAAEAQRRADAAARVERERLAAQARAKQEEADALTERARQEGIAAEEAGNVQALENATATILAATNARAEAEEAAATMEVMIAPVVASDAPRVAGISTSKTWKARVTDLPALLAFIAAHPECHDWIDVKMAPLNGMAKALKKNMKVAGVEAYEEVNMSARAA